jgi:hypothetical protein
MRAVVICLLAVLAIAAPSQSATLNLPEPPLLEVAGGPPRAVPIVLRLSDELTSQLHVVKTSPFDTIRYPIGSYSAALLEKNLGRVFRTDAPEQGSQDAGRSVPVLELTIESFAAVIPHPAYKPYAAEVVYRATVTDPDGTVLFSSAATASAQTSKGMVSGIQAKSLAGEAAARAMNDAMTQLLESLLTAEELDGLEAPAVSDGSGANAGGEP